MCHALIFTAVFSRHVFVWLSFTQTTDAVIAGCEAAWRFFEGVFKVLIPGQPDAGGDRGGRVGAEVERGVRRVRAVPRVRDRPGPCSHTDGQAARGTDGAVRAVRFWNGETFRDLADAQAKVDAWCTGRAGMRVHGTTQCRPLEHFRLEEQLHLLPPPAGHYDVPIYATCRVHRDHHIEIAKALYSIPGNLLGGRRLGWLGPDEGARCRLAEGGYDRRSTRGIQ